MLTITKRTEAGLWSASKLHFTWVDQGSRQQLFPVSTLGVSDSSFCGYSPVKLYKVTFVRPWFCLSAERVMILEGSVYCFVRSVSIDTKLWVKNFLWIGVSLLDVCLHLLESVEELTLSFTAVIASVSFHMLIVLAWTIFRVQSPPNFNVFLFKNLNGSYFLEIKNDELLSLCLQCSFL